MIEKSTFVSAPSVTPHTRQAALHQASSPFLLKCYEKIVSLRVLVDIGSVGIMSGDHCRVVSAAVAFVPTRNRNVRLADQDDDDDDE